MDRRLLNSRGPYPTLNRLPEDPVDIERWHVLAARRLASEMPAELADRLPRIAVELELHIAELELRQSSVSYGRRPARSE